MKIFDWSRFEYCFSTYFGCECESTILKCVHTHKITMIENRIWVNYWFGNTIILDSVSLSKKTVDIDTVRFKLTLSSLKLIIFSHLILHAYQIVDKVTFFWYDWNMWVFTHLKLRNKWGRAWNTHSNYFWSSKDHLPLEIIEKEIRNLGVKFIMRKMCMLYDCYFLNVFVKTKFRTGTNRFTHFHPYLHFHHRIFTVNRYIFQIDCFFSSHF